MAASTQKTKLPLSALLSQVLIAFTREHERAAPGADHLPTLPMWACFLRVITEDGVQARDIPKLARISRRAVPPLMTGIGRDTGLVEVDNPSGTRGGGIAKLTGQGRLAADAARDAIQATEKKWAKRFGKQRMSSARAALETIVQQFDLELPHYPITYGAVDPTITGGWHVAAKEGPPRIPNHGADWAPVIRQKDADTVSGLPFFALVSQALVEFAIDYESRAGSLWIAAMILSTIGDKGTPLEDAPAAAGITGAGKSLLERHRIVTVKSKRVVLTGTGKRIRDAYAPLTAHVEGEWIERFGKQNIAALRAALTALTNDLDPSLPHYPTLSWTGGLREIPASHPR